MNLSSGFTASEVVGVDSVCEYLCWVVLQAEGAVKCWHALPVGFVGRRFTRKNFALDFFLTFDGREFE